jgi:mannose-1-phosphate guanylyltransferase
MRAIVMAGGQGTRLRPLTYVIPKPLMPVGKKPILELMLEQLRSHGFDDVTVTLGHQGGLIRAYFGDGSTFGVRVQYVEEPAPLGTAGALRLLAGELHEPFVVVNGDILTEIDLGAMLALHRRRKAALTLAVTEHRMQVPFGVVESRKGRLVTVREKPELSFTISAGVYMMDPRTLRHLPVEGPAEMTDLVEALTVAGEVVATFPFAGPWCDFGRFGEINESEVQLWTAARAA